MACPKYGDGSLWGDGDLWCRLYGSSSYILPVEKQVKHLAVEVAHSGSDFSIVWLSATINIDPNLFGRYRATFDHDIGGSVSAEVSHSGSDFKIDRLTLDLRSGPVIESAYQATFDTNAGEFVSAEVAISGVDFAINSLRLVAQLTHRTRAN